MRLPRGSERGGGGPPLCASGAVGATALAHAAAADAGRARRRPSSRHPDHGRSIDGPRAREQSRRRQSLQGGERRRESRQWGTGTDTLDARADEEQQRQRRPAHSEFEGCARHFLAHPRPATRPDQPARPIGSRLGAKQVVALPVELRWRERRRRFAVLAPSVLVPAVAVGGELTEHKRQPARGHDAGALCRGAGGNGSLRKLGRLLLKQ